MPRILIFLRISLSYVLQTRTKLQNGHKRELEQLSTWVKDEVAACTEEELEWKSANRREAFV